MREDPAANAMLDAIERLIEAAIADRPEMRAPLSAIVRRLLPDLVPAIAPPKVVEVQVSGPALDPLVASQILAGLRAGDNRKWTGSEHDARARARALLAELMTPASDAANEEIAA